ncbi:hypothetical protein CI105_01295 [Candidatus Izimaplasma bacterium ZiA1]|uniref:ABC transporter ATP-binding protein/permease n=1 Tax=Candidatus Izimoplasma sp. ZiA1 TaxID=2024899 RepID=UPI000BAA6296|nr:hypothetical protein CI105_01295 [Candidatus Izimaplasma bacterium ZiA1]
MIKLNEIHKVYTQGKVGFHALKDINLFFKKDETIAILGPSGCGKTTLLNILGGLDTPTTGDMVIDSKLTTNFTESEWDYFRNHRIGFVFQQYNLIEHLPIVENVAISVKLSGVSHKDSHKRAIELLTKVGLKDHLQKLPNQLSGGERQRVAIARALINNPDIILADEPTGALDKKTGNEVMDLIKEVGKDKLVIIVTHNKKVANKYATRIIELEDGRVKSDTSPKDEKVKIILKREKNRKKLKFKEAIRLAYYNIKGKKWRTFLVSLGLSVGIVGLILIDALFNSIRTGLEQQTAVIQNNPDIYIMADDESTTIDLALTAIENTNYFKEVFFAPRQDFQIVKNITKDSNLLSNVGTNVIGTPQSTEIKSVFTNILGDGRLPNSDNEFALPLDTAKKLINSNIYLSNDEIWELLKNNIYLIHTDFEYSVAYIPSIETNCIYTSMWDGDTNNLPLEYNETELGTITENLNALSPYRSTPIVVGDKNVFCGDYSEIYWEIDYDTPVGEGTEFKLVGIFDNKLFKEALFSEDTINSIGSKNSYIYPSSEETNPIDEFYRYRAFLKNDNVSNKTDIMRSLEERGYIVRENVDFGLDLFSGITNLFIYILQFIFSSITLIAVVTGSLMLLLILYIGVVERRREIGLIRSMGGSRSDVRLIYTGETTLIGLIAGFLSILISLVLVVILNIYIYNNYQELVLRYLPFVDPKKVLSINYAKLIYAIIGSILLAIVSGLIPSIIAGKKKPIEALRNE